MFCSKCGNLISDDSKFCPTCGQAVEQTVGQNGTANYTQNYYQYSGTTMNSTNSKSISFKNPNILGIVAGVLSILCTFLTYAKASVFGVSATQTLIDGGDGVFFIVLGIIAIVFSVINKEKAILITGIVTCALTLFEVYDFSDVVNQNELGGLLERGFGFYLMIIAAVLMVIAAPVWKKIKR